MKLLVTGLCLGGNQGGPAIALSLRRAMRRHVPEAQFVFSVPGGAAWSHEQRWADHYRVDAVEDFTWQDLAGVDLHRVRHLGAAGLNGCAPRLRS